MHHFLSFIAVAGIIGFAGAAYAEDGPDSLTNPSTVTESKDIEVGAGIICDTPQQVKRYLTFADEPHGADSVDRALDAVNTEENNPRACGVAIIAFVRDGQSETVEFNHSVAKVTRVRVVAVATQEGWRHVPAVVQYTAISEPGQTI